MKIAVVNNWVPFLRGGAEHLADALVTKLNEFGHQAMLVRIPFRWEPPGKILEHMLACRLLRLPNVERVIALKFPAYYIPHAHKTLWLLHQFRQAYDLWETPLQGLPGNSEGRAIRDSIIAADNEFLPECVRLFANSEVTAGRLKRFNGLDAEVLYAPLLETSHFHAGPYGDYLYCAARISGGKRQALAVEAMRYVTTPVRLVLAGHPDSPADLEVLESLIQQHSLHSRVQIVPRFVTEQEKASALAGSLACPYLPYDEDSYGYVTGEAFLSRRPVVTTTDSGGLLALVRDGETGFVTPPDPKALAAAFDRLYSDRPLAERLGNAGHARMHSLNINWEQVIRKLTA